MYLATGPNARFASGLPELNAGGLKTGYSWGADTDGDLVFRSHDSAGAATERIRLNIDGTFQINDHGSIIVGDGSATQTVNIAPANI